MDLAAAPDQARGLFEPGRMTLGCSVKAAGVVRRALSARWARVYEALARLTNRPPVANSGASRMQVLRIAIDCKKARQPVRFNSAG